MQQTTLEFQTCSPNPIFLCRYTLRYPFVDINLFLILANTFLNLLMFIDLRVEFISRHFFDTGQGLNSIILSITDTEMNKTQ